MSKFQFGQISADTTKVSQLDNRPQIGTTELKGTFDYGANAVKTEVNTQLTNFNTAVTDSITVSSTDGQIPTAKAVYDKVAEIQQMTSLGDMAKSTYDTNSSGVVDNAEKLENNSVNDLLKTIYPVGSIYMTTNNVNPQTWISGTTWVAWGGGRVPLGCNETYSTPNAEGGSATVTLTTDNIPSHTHTFNGSNNTTSTNYASHYHTFSGTTSNNGKHHNKTFSWATMGIGDPTAVAGGSNAWATTTLTDFDISGDGSHTHTYSGSTSYASHDHSHTIIPSGTNSSTGGGQAHSNMQPYVTCYMWRRTV